MDHDQSKFVTSYLVDGKRLEARRISGRVLSGPPIVMLHEGLGSMSHWRDFPGQVAAEIGLDGRTDHFLVRPEGLEPPAY